MTTETGRNGKTIGGFFGLDHPQAPVPQSLLSHWRIVPDRTIAFQNARSALRYLLEATSPEKIWLPAFICKEVLQAVPKSIKVEYFNINNELSPNINLLDENLSPGDCVLAVDYFGRGIGSEAAEFVKNRPDVLWIEDRAQAIDPAESPWGDWLLYSPRKVVGVPDGGLLVGQGTQIPVPDYDPIEDADFMIPSLIRSELAVGADTSGAYEKYAATEKRMRAGRTRMSRLSMAVLSSVDAAKIIEKRKRNYRALAAALMEFSLLGDSTVDDAPFGFPVRVPECNRIWSELRAKGIFAARHWRELPSPKSAFPWEHELSCEIMTLPVDQRYGEEEMQRINQAFLRAVG